MGEMSFEDVIARLPFPVALRCRLIMAQAEKRSAVESIIDAFESLVKFLALVVISDYLTGAVQDARTDERLKSLFSSKISTGKWEEILRETLRVYTKEPEKAFMPELLNFYFQENKLTRQAQLFENWGHRRNNFRAHPDRIISETVVKGKWTEWWPEFRSLVSSMAFLTNYQMIVPAFIKRGAITKARICTGPSEFFIFREDYELPLTIKGVEAEESLLLIDLRNRRRQLLLYPFMVVKAPAYFYLFERCERYNGNLNKVVFASLGPGEALVVKRADPTRTIIEDIESRLGRFGDFGVPVDDVPEQPEAMAAYKPDFLREAEQAARRWSDAGYPYHLVEGISQSLVSQIRNPDGVPQVLSEEVSAFLMVAAHHHGGNWCYWVSANRHNPSAIEHLLRILKIYYDRPRLRALYSLQHLGLNDMEQALRQTKTRPTSDIEYIISEYVIPGRVVEYLKKIAKGQDADLAKKTKAVLREISQYCGEETGADELSGLPLV